MPPRCIPPRCYKAKPVDVSGSHDNRCRHYGARTHGPRPGPGGRSRALDYAPRKLPKLELFLPKYKSVLPEYQFFFLDMRFVFLNVSVSFLNVSFVFQILVVPS